MADVLRTVSSVSHNDPIVVRIYDPRPRYRGGGLVDMAETVRQGGEMGDDVLIHVTPGEYEQMCAAWGEPTMNSNTGLPEWGLSRVFKKAKKFVKRLVKNPIVGTIAPIAMNMLLPGVGGLIGQSLFGAASSSAKGGDPLFGALTGAGSHLLGGGNAQVGGGDGVGTLSKLAGKIPTSAGLAQDAASAPVAAGASVAGGKPGILSRLGDVIKPGVEGLLEKSASPLGRLSTALGAEYLRSGQAAYDQSEEAATSGPGLPDGFGDPLPAMEFSRDVHGMRPEDYLTYGQTGGEHLFFGNNRLPVASAGTADGAPVLSDTLSSDFQPAGGGIYSNIYINPKTGESITKDEYLRRFPIKLADGGGIRGPGTGRSDDIEALLSDGEYVIDAESVALLGDGSTEAGVRKLDEMRRELRKHKGRALSRGRFSPDARRPTEYMRGGRSKKSRGGALRKLSKRVGEKVKVVDGGPPDTRKMSEAERKALLEAIRRFESAHRAGGRQRLARGGPAYRALEQLASRFERAISRGDEFGIREIGGAIERARGGAARRAVDAYARGGRVAEALRRLFGGAEKTPATDHGPFFRRRDDMPVHEVYPNEVADLAEMAEELRKLSPESNVLRQYVFDRRKRRLSGKSKIEQLLAEEEL